MLPMISIKTLVVGISLVASTSILNAQTAARNAEPAHITETSKMYSYQFEGKLTPTEIELLKEDILKMQFVKEVKVEYKDHKSAGQVRLITLEKFTNTDTEFQFSIYNLKELLISKNLFPSNYTFEVLSTK